MAKKLRYWGEFSSLQKDLWRIEIWQEGFTGDSREVVLGGNPVVVEWQETDKLEPIQSSSATIELLSRADREFLDMYTVKAGSVRLDIRLNGTLYWCGTLDTELYEEPYNRLNNYYVSLTFSDFAVLEREVWKNKQFVTIREVINQCMTLADLTQLGVTSYISTQLSQGDSGNILDTVCVNGANFFDEDDTAMSVREVLTEVFRPLALRIKQKAGKIWVYDLNKLHGAFTPQTVSWRNGNTILSQDVVYNNVVIHYSPYGSSNVMQSEVDRSSVKSGDVYTYPVSEKDSTHGFDLDLSAEGDGQEKAAWAKYYKITPFFSGSEYSGVAQRVEHATTSGPSDVILDDSKQFGIVVRSPQRTFICQTTDISNYLLKLTVPLLVDAYLNPFETIVWSDYIAQRTLIAATRIYRQRCHLRLYNSGEGGVYTNLYENNSVVTSGSYKEQGNWVQGQEDPGKYMYLCYYEFEDRDKDGSSGVTGWKTNKQAIGNYFGKLPTSWERRGDGEFIPLPNATGFLEFSVDSEGYGVNDKGEPFAHTELPRFFHLYGEIKIELVDRETGKAVPQEDIETMAWLNKDAKEELPIDTIVGTMDKPSPIAKGQLFRASDKQVIGTMYRAGVTDRVEKLLIGTVYSNYATRHQTLTGDAALLKTFSTLTDKHTPGVYILLKETQNLRNGISSISMVQVDTDKYKGA